MKLSYLLFSPVYALHEFTHGLAARPWANSVEYATADDGQPYVEIEYPEGTPVVAVLFADLAPTLIGLVSAVLFHQSLNPFHPDLSLTTAILRVLLVAGLFVYSYPSVEDRRLFVHWLDC